MKKNVFLSLALVAGVMLLTSCNSTKVSSYSMAPYRYVTGVGVLNVPTLADLEVASQNKIYEHLSVKVEITDGAISAETIENTVNKAIAGLLLKQNADVLVQPVIRVETKGRTINIEVSGYPATYKNFRPMTKEDAILFKDVDIQHIPQGVATSVITTKK